jgi:cobalt-zinc-cadmium efflux system membrane fusion protein
MIMKPFTIYVALVCMLTACGSHTVEVPKDDTLISDSLYKHVQTAPATFEQPSESIKLNGKIEPN